MTGIMRISLGLGLATLAVMAVIELPTLLGAAGQIPLLACKMAQMISGLWG